MKAKEGLKFIKKPILQARWTRQSGLLLQAPWSGWAYRTVDKGREVVLQLLIHGVEWGADVSLCKAETYGHTLEGGRGTPLCVQPQNNRESSVC